MTKSISCKDAGKDCTWSATHESEEALMSMVKEHVLAEHKEIELNPENIANIKSLIKTTGRFWWWG
jgi:predicted small metal-binding protein